MPNHVGLREPRRHRGGVALLVAPFEVDNDEPRVGLMPARARSLDLERIAETEAVELLELGGAWSSYRDALRRGWFADGIHPSAAGLEMIAGRIAMAILARFDVPCAQRESGETPETAEPR